MASLGDLVVNLKANSASYTRSMQAAQKQATVFAAAAGAAAAAAVAPWERFAMVLWGLSARQRVKARRLPEQENRLPALKNSIRQKVTRRMDSFACLAFVANCEEELVSSWRVNIISFFLFF